MRSILEILIAVQAGQPATDAEVRLCLLAVDSMRSPYKRVARAVGISLEQLLTWRLIGRQTTEGQWRSSCGWWMGFCWRDGWDGE